MVQSCRITMRPAGASCRAFTAPRQTRARCVAASQQADPSPAPQQAGPTRRQLAALAAAAAAATLAPGSAQAIGFKKELNKKKVPVEDYSELPDGLKYYELAPGRGDPVREGAAVTVHFDCFFRGVDAVSTRAARVLNGNRVLAEPFEFVAGQPVSGVKAAKISEGANGLFAGAGGPKPPPALSTAVLGMRPGGKRSVIVPPELGYGGRGELEIPPNQSFELQIEVLSVR